MADCTCNTGPGTEGPDEWCPLHGREEAVVEGMLNDAAAAFDKLCQERHAVGQERYGELTFLENDVLRMMLEELADTVNYCRMQAVKLMLLQDKLEADLADKLDVQKVDNIEGAEITMGFQKLKGTKPVGWQK